MANSYVEYRDKAVRINDQILTIITMLAADVVRVHPVTPEALALVKEWPDQALNAPPGLIDIDLTGFWMTDDGECELHSVLDLVAKKVDSLGDTIPAELLNDLAKSNTIRFVPTESALVLRPLNEWKRMLGERRMSGDGDAP